MESATDDQHKQSAGSHSATSSDESKLSVSSEKLGDLFEDNLDRHCVSDSIAKLQPPTVQSMESSPENTPGYRIPSSVFARTSGAPGEWSTASNESLFSIQTGNMSFTREYFQYLGKSGELGTFKSGDLGMYKKSGELGMYRKSRELSMYRKSGELGTEQNKSMELGVSGEPLDMGPTTTGQMMSLSNCPQAAYQACPNSHPGLDLAEAAAAETMKEVIRENEQSRCEIKVSSQNNGNRSPTSSDDGGASVQSFAFPLSGDSLKSGAEDISLRPLKSSQKPQPLPDSTLQTTSKDEPSNAAQPAQATTSWFSCFSCWPNRSGS